MCSTRRKVHCLFLTVLAICLLSGLCQLLFSGLLSKTSFKFGFSSLFDNRCEMVHGAQKVLQRADADGGNVSLHSLHPAEEGPMNVPGSIPAVVHYLWCGNKKFRFKDYLSVVSANTMFRPLKLVFHYTHQPQTDDYNVWFKTLLSAVPGLEMQQLKSAPSCGSVNMLNTALGLLSVDGGIFVGENTILTFAIKALTVKTDLWFAFSNNTSDKTGGVVVAKTGFNESVKAAYFKRITSTVTTAAGCASLDNLSGSVQGRYCVVVPGRLYPRDIIEATTSFAELARLLFYGRRDPITPLQNTSNLIPRIAHFLRFENFRGKGGYYRHEFSFSHLLSVLSALYVAGFEHVYIHVDVEPTGRWWNELAKENVTVVKVVRPNSIFQQPIGVIQHTSDVGRYLVLYKYGGAYQDFDVTWTSYVPDSLLSYSFVAGMEWVQFHEEWPETFNLGVMLAKPGAPWLQHYLKTHTDYRDSDWGYNSLMMSYKTYELHPHLMYLDRKLQVICFKEICHPPWEKSYVRGINDQSPTIPFRWQEVRSIHVTYPKPHPSLASPEQVVARKDMNAEIGRHILEKSGRHHFLS